MKKSRVLAIIHFQVFEVIGDTGVMDAAGDEHASRHRRALHEFHRARELGDAAIFLQHEDVVDSLDGGVGPNHAPLHGHTAGGVGSATHRRDQPESTLPCRAHA